MATVDEVGAGTSDDTLVSKRLLQAFAELRHKYCFLAQPLISPARLTVGHLLEHNTSDFRCCTENDTPLCRKLVSCVSNV